MATFGPTISLPNSTERADFRRHVAGIDSTHVVVVQAPDPLHSTDQWEVWLLERDGMNLSVIGTMSISQDDWPREEEYFGLSVISSDTGAWIVPAWSQNSGGMGLSNIKLNIGCFYINKSTWEMNSLVGSAILSLGRASGARIAPVRMCLAKRASPARYALVCWFDEGYPHNTDPFLNNRSRIASVSFTGGPSGTQVVVTEIDEVRWDHNLHITTGTTTENPARMVGHDICPLHDDDMQFLVAYYKLHSAGSPTPKRADIVFERWNIDMVTGALTRPERLNIGQVATLSVVQSERVYGVSRRGGSGVTVTHLTGHEDTEVDLKARHVVVDDGSLAASPASAPIYADFLRSGGVSAARQADVVNTRQGYHRGYGPDVDGGGGSRSQIFAFTLDEQATSSSAPTIAAMPQNLQALSGRNAPFPNTGFGVSVAYNTQGNNDQLDAYVYSLGLTSVPELACPDEPSLIIPSLRLISRDDEVQAPRIQGYGNDPTSRQHSERIASGGNVYARAASRVRERESCLP